MKTIKLFLFLLCATPSFAQLKFLGAGGVGDGKAVPSVGINVGWRGWEGEIRAGFVEERKFLLLKLGREVREIALLAEGRAGGSPYLLLLVGKELPSPSKESSFFLGGGSLLLTGEKPAPVAATAMSMAINRKGWRVGTEIVFTFPIKPNVLIKFAIPFHHKKPKRLAH